MQTKIILWKGGKNVQNKTVKSKKNKLHKKPSVGIQKINLPRRDYVKNSTPDWIWQSWFTLKEADSPVARMVIRPSTVTITDTFVGCWPT